MLDIVVNGKRCVGCYLCVEGCPAGVFEFNHRTKKPKVVAPNLCLVCRTCEYVCAPEAVTVKMREWRRLPQDRLVEFL